MTDAAVPITVAQAAPAAPQFIIKMNIGSKLTFITMPTSIPRIAVPVAPSLRITPERAILSSETAINALIMEKYSSAYTNIISLVPLTRRMGFLSSSSAAVIKIPIPKVGNERRRAGSFRIFVFARAQKTGNIT